MSPHAAQDKHRADFQALISQRRFAATVRRNLEARGYSGERHPADFQALISQRRFAATVRRNLEARGYSGERHPADFLALIFAMLHGRSELRPRHHPLPLC
jgi:hypothetical protein